MNPDQLPSPTGFTGSETDYDDITNQYRITFRDQCDGTEVVITNKAVNKSEAVGSAILRLGKGYVFQGVARVSQ